MADIDAPRGGRGNGGNGGSSWGRAAAGAWGSGGGGDGHDAELAAAIAASLADHSGPSGTAGEQQQQQGGSSAVAEQQQQRLRRVSFDLPGSGDEMDPELAAAIAASMEQPATGNAPATAAAQQGAAAAAADTSTAPAAADAAAEAQPELPELGEEPEAGSESAMEVALRLPTGRVSRRFDRESATVGHLAAFAAQQGVAMGRHQLALSFPRRVLSDWGQSLVAAGVVHKDLVSVEPQ